MVLEDEERFLLLSRPWWFVSSSRSALCAKTGVAGQAGSCWQKEAGVRFQREAALRESPIRCCAETRWFVVARMLCACGVREHLLRESGVLPSDPPHVGPVTFISEWFSRRGRRLLKSCRTADPESSPAPVDGSDSPACRRQCRCTPCVRRT